MLLFSNVVFEWALKTRPERKQSEPNSELRRNSENNGLQNEKNYILMLKVTTCAFVLLQFMSFALYSEAVRRNGLGLKDGSGGFFWALARLPSIVNSSLNVVFYSSSAMFRKALKKYLAKVFIGEK